MRWFWLCAIIGGVFGQRRMLNLNVDQVCKSGPDIWKCKSQTNCPTLKGALENGILPEICTFIGTETIFCCPPTNLSGSSTNGSQTTVQSEKRPIEPAIPKPLNTSNTNHAEIKEKHSVENGQKSNGSEPLTTSATSKADEMCKEYSKYVYTIQEVFSMLPGVKPKKIKIEDCSFQPLIVGGVAAKPKEFPHMALIGYGESPLITWICGGSLISPKFVLTAAHCSETNSSVKYWVRLGELDLSTEKEDSEPINIQVVKQIIHPQYNGKLMYHDIALFELASEVKFSTYIRPLCLQTSKNIGSDKYVATGWGYTRWEGRPSKRLQKVTLPAVSIENCNKEYSFYSQDEIPNGIVNDLMVCAGGERGKDTCQGDSGGPLQIQHQKIFCMYSLLGVTSFGRGCALGDPGIYTRVSNYVPWIEKIVWP